MTALWSHTCTHGWQPITVGGAELFQNPRLNSIYRDLYPAIDFDNFVASLYNLDEASS